MRSETMSLKIRQAEARDALELARLRWEFRPETHLEQSREQFAREFEAWLADALASDWVAWVAEDGTGALVGCLFLRSVDKVPDPGAPNRAWGYLTNSYVAPAHRGQGLGGQLLDALIAAARERGHEFLIVWPSEDALSFYTRAGFREVADVHRGLGDYPPLELVLS